MLRRIVARSPAPRDFVAALRRPGLGLVAEVKKGSPSKGPFARDLDHVAAARAFRDGGAVAISVLTAPAFFAGDAELSDVAMPSPPTPPPARRCCARSSSSTRTRCSNRARSAPTPTS